MFKSKKKSNNANYNIEKVKQLEIDQSEDFEEKDQDDRLQDQED